MNPEEHNALPQELEDSLRALGDVRAPSELADRVRLARLGQVSAPAELRDRVEMALFGAAQRSQPCRQASPAHTAFPTWRTSRHRDLIRPEEQTVREVPHLARR